MFIRFERHVPHGYTRVHAMQHLQYSADSFFPQNPKNKAESGSFEKGLGSDDGRYNQLKTMTQ